MAKRLQEYVRYTTEELDTYVKTAGSCVHRVNTEMHLSMGPHVLGDFKNSLLSQITKERVGFYDSHLDGMILDVKRIKVLGRQGTQRADEPRIHVRIKADVYIFKPEKAAILEGLVKHIGAQQIGVTFYRIFNANLKLSHREVCGDINLNDTVKFSITNYNFRSNFPSLDGELLNLVQDPTVHVKKDIKQETPNRICVNQCDSGVDLRDDTDQLSELLDILKNEDKPTDSENVSALSRKSTKSWKKPSIKYDDSDEVSESSKPVKRKLPRISENKSKKTNLSMPYSSSNIQIKVEELSD